MRFPSLFLTVALARSSIADYVLEDDYSPSKFFDMFNFFSGKDPTHGFVKYVDQGTAQGSGLIKTTTDSIYMGVDTENVTPNGRPSVRIESKKKYNSGLVILDLAHMPGSICGTWPAFWMVGSNWPYNGEIDIIEGVNSQRANAMALHTGPGCTINPSNSIRAFSGSIRTSNCDVKAEGQSWNAGCSIKTPETHAASYGDDFNAANGGVYATEWTNEGISIWHFTRSAIPADITAGNPDPSNWGRPLAIFHGGCDFSTAFKQQRIVFDTTFCGDWAGNVWGIDATCASKASSCEAFVRDNPSAFQESFWRVQSLRVYQKDTSQGVIGRLSKSSETSPSPSTIPSSSSRSSTVTPSTLQTSLRTSSVRGTTSPSPSPSPTPPGSKSPVTVTKTQYRTVYVSPSVERRPIVTKTRFRTVFVRPSSTLVAVTVTDEGGSTIQVVTIVA